MSNTESNETLLFVTGLSGAGMSSVLDALEDLGYEALDNIPVFLVDPFLQRRDGDSRPVAIGIDTRTRDFAPVTLVQKAKETGAKLLFITCDNAVLQRRFSETRRRHPLARDRTVIDGIDMERRLLEPLRGDSDAVIDTSDLSIHDLRSLVRRRYDISTKNGLSLTLMSFGFKYGLPREADIVADLRFLKNPHYVAELSSLTGHDRKVGAYIERDPAFAVFVESFQNLYGPLLPRYTAEGKSYLTIALGCTGGRHRSVFAVETLKGWAEGLGYTPHIYHREL